jgi:integrase
VPPEVKPAGDYFATALITAGADPTDVQKALRHSSLRITLETYVHWWPKKQRRRSVVGTALQEAADKRRHSTKSQDHG